MSGAYVVSSGEVVSVHAVRAGATVTCRRGLVWVTIDGDPGDYILGPGQSFIARGGAHLVIEALRPSAFELPVAQPAVSPAVAGSKR